MALFALVDALPGGCPVVNGIVNGKSSPESPPTDRVSFSAPVLGKCPSRSPRRFSTRISTRHSRCGPNLFWEKYHWHAKTEEKTQQTQTQLQQPKNVASKRTEVGCPTQRGIHQFLGRRAARPDLGEMPEVRDMQAQAKCEV